MENFIFALNATIPVFLMILLGFFLQKIHFLNEPFNQTANAYVFRCALPISLFLSIAEMDFYSDFDLTFCLFCFLGTSLMFMGVWAAAWLLMKGKGQVGAFSQASVRSSAAVLGIAFATNIYGNAGMVPMMIMSAVPFFNIYSVLILSFSPQVGENGQLLPAAHGMEAVKKAGYEQPPAAQYRMVWTGEIYCPTGQSDTEILQRLFSELSVELPEDCNGRPMSLSDVVELEYPMKRIYYYVNGDTQFQQVKFSPMLAKKKVSGGA